MTIARKVLMHSLESRRIDPNNTTKVRRKLIEDGADLWEGNCICGEWSVPLGTESQITALFSEHLIDVLGHKPHSGIDITDDEVPF